MPLAGLVALRDIVSKSRIALSSDTSLSTGDSSSSAAAAVAATSSAKTSCNRCLHPLRRPLKLECSHELCYSCVASMTTISQLTCPLCSRTMAIDLTRLLDVDVCSSFATGGGAFSLGSSKKVMGLTASVSEYRAWVFDMDGVLHRHGVPIPGAVALLELLRDRNVPFVLMTNECRYTNSTLAANLANWLSAKAAPMPEEIYSAANSIGDFFQRLFRHGARKSTYFIGEDGIANALADAYESVRGASSFSRDEPVPPGAEVGYVVVGAVFQENTRNIERAAEFVKKGAKLIYSCPDWFDVTSEGAFSFGSPMHTVSLIERVTGVTGYCTGKPSPHLLRSALRLLRTRSDATLEEKDVIVVGDSLNTDIRCAVENGVDCALVLSGTTSRESLACSALQPNLVFDSCRDIANQYLETEALFRGDDAEEEAEEAARKAKKAKRG